MDEVIEIGGNKFKLWLGTIISNYGSKLVNKGKTTIISNPSCRLINPFTTIYTFTINNNEKYQLIIQGNYKDKYKEISQLEGGAEENSPITTDEMFLVIANNVKRWFKKD